MFEFLKKQVKKSYRPLLAQGSDILALNLLKHFDFGYIPWTGASVRPAALCAILNELIINNRKNIVEFGAGVSTLYMAAVLKREGGRIVSFEHSPEWSEIVRRLLARFGLGEVATVVQSPLAPCSAALDGCLWYDERLVRDTLLEMQLDGLVVDGPPASSKAAALARFPALPIVSDRLGKSFFVYLDDILRVGEKEVLRRWQRMLGISPTVEIIAGQYAMFRKGGKFAVGMKRYY